MKSQRFVLAALLAVAAAYGAAAQEPARLASDSPCCTIPARTEIRIEVTDRVHSRLNQTGQSFAFRLAEPLTVDGNILIPAGTPGVGEVVHAARARAMGKAGELILAARYLQFGETRIPLRTLRFGREQGRDNSGTVSTINMISAATVPGLSLIGFVIAGGEVDVPAGTRATAQITSETVLPPHP